MSQNNFKKFKKIWFCNWIIGFRPFIFIIYRSYLVFIIKNEYYLLK